MRRLAAILAIAFLAASVPAVAEDAADVEGLAARIEALEAKVAQVEDALMEVRDITVEGIDSIMAMLEDREAEVSAAETQAPEFSRDWRTFARGWEYRNASILQTEMGPRFVVEVRRTGSAVRVAYLSVTLYAETGNIVGMGDEYVQAMQTGDIKVVRFWLDGDASKAANFRLQVDSEL